MMLNAIRVSAPWMDPRYAESIIRDVISMSEWERWPKPHILGENLRLTNAEREHFGLWHIMPCDISAEDLAEQKKRKDRERKRRRRAEQGGQDRAAYLRTHSVNRTKPWEQFNMSRATFYRLKKQGLLVPSALSHVVA
jgi:hypothetical protein